ncbi:MAG: hypothetical protein ACHQ1H_00980 [Nitrososphaerales archaeon]
MAQQESEPQKSLKRLTWQYENCLSCVYFHPNDLLNADLFERGACTHPKMKPFDLVISGRDWCNLYKEMPQKTIDALQENAMKK